MWGGPTPHNLVILCLCYANQTCSEVPISSLNRDTARLGRGDRILLPSVIPAQVQGHHNTTRSTLMIGYPLRIQRRQTRRRITPGIPPFLAVASVDRMQQGIWGWPVQSPRHLQELILSQKPRRKQKKRAIKLELLRSTLSGIDKSYSWEQVKGLLQERVFPWCEKFGTWSSNRERVD